MSIETVSKNSARFKQQGQTVPIFVVTVEFHFNFVNKARTPLGILRYAQRS